VRLASRQSQARGRLAVEEDDDNHGTMPYELYDERLHGTEGLPYHIAWQLALTNHPMPMPENLRELDPYTFANYLLHTVLRVEAMPSQHGSPPRQSTIAHSIAPTHQAPPPPSVRSGRRRPPMGSIADDEATARATYQRTENWALRHSQIAPERPDPQLGGQRDQMQPGPERARDRPQSLAFQSE
jgi:hypothetical protein